MTAISNNNNTRFIIGVLVVALLAILAYGFLNMPDRRSTGQKVDDAVHTLSDGQGVDDAARQLESRTPAERIKDGVKDATDGNPQ